MDWLLTDIISIVSARIIKGPVMIDFEYPISFRTDDVTDAILIFLLFNFPITLTFIIFSTIFIIPFVDYGLRRRARFTLSPFHNGKESFWSDSRDLSLSLNRCFTSSKLLSGFFDFFVPICCCDHYCLNCHYRLFAAILIKVGSWPSCFDLGGIASLY